MIRRRAIFIYIFLRLYLLPIPLSSYALTSHPKNNIRCVSTQLRYSNYDIHNTRSGYTIAKDITKAHRIQLQLNANIDSLDSDDNNVDKDFNNKEQSKADTSSNLDSGDDFNNKKQSTSSDTSTTPFVGLPSYRRIIWFVATTFLIWVSEPLLSLVDSAAVGRYAGLTSTQSSSSPNLSSVVQLAALGPATTVCDSSIYLTLFIAMATTNKLAKAFAKDDLDEQITTISHVMGVSLAVGTILLLFINLQGGRLISSILGQAGATVSIGSKVIDLTPEVLRASLGYARIRSIASPLAVMGLTAQSALLCAQDTTTPALAVGVASITNIIGDYIFVAKFRWGVRGAALATSMASFLANSILIRKVYKMFETWKDAYRERMKREKVLQSVLDTDISKGRERDPLTTPFLSFPDRQSLISLLLLAGPMFFVMLGKILGYSAMTVRAGSFGMVSLACHNVLVRIFFFFATVGDSLSQSAQTFLPGLFYRKSLEEEKEDTTNDDTTAQITTPSSDGNDARTLVKRLLLISSTMGVVNCISGRWIALNAGATFTSNAALVSLMSHVSPFMGLALLLHPLTMALEGSIIAASDSGYLVGTYVASILALLGWLKFICKDFLGVWHGILVFQALRISQFGLRVWRRTASNRKRKSTQQ